MLSTETLTLRVFEFRATHLFKLRTMGLPLDCLVNFVYALVKGWTS